MFDRLEIQSLKNSYNLEFSRFQSLYTFDSAQIVSGARSLVIDGYSMENDLPVKLKMPNPRDCSLLYGNTAYRINEDYLIHDYLQEAFIMGALRGEKGVTHRNIVELYDFILLDIDTALVPVIVMESIPGKILSRWRPTELLHLDLQAKLNFIQGFGNAVDFVHSRGLVVGDISDRSFVMGANSEQGKLIDFGEAKIIGNKSSAHSYGFAPKTVLKDSIWMPIDEVWAFTAVVFKMLSNGLYPFRSNGDVYSLDDAVKNPKNLEKLRIDNFLINSGITSQKLSLLNTLFQTILNERDSHFDSCHKVYAAIINILQS